MMLHCIHSKILCLELLAFTLLFSGQEGSAFVNQNSTPLELRSPRLSTTLRQNWLGDVWEEVIEFSTYGPSERKLLKERREKAAEEERRKNGGDVSMESFQKAQQKFATASPKTAPSNDESDSLSLGSFQAAVASKENEQLVDREMEFDGYKLRDLIVEKWGVPLDIDFQRGYGGNSVYCTVLPVAFGSSRCRHDSELDYLMHLQGVVEVLMKYDNLDPFLFFVQTTEKTPKPGVESAPYLMQLDDEALKQIL